MIKMQTLVVLTILRLPIKDNIFLICSNKNKHSYSKLECLPYIDMIKVSSFRMQQCVPAKILFVQHHPC